MNKQFYDLNIETLDDGTIRLEQRDYCGESVILDLHPAQVAYIADSLTVNTPERIQTQPNWATERIAILERRMCWMRDRFEECYAALPSDMYERCSEANAFYAWLQASVDVATEYCADLTSWTHPSTVTDTLQQSVDANIPNNTGRSSEPSERLNAELF